jgi:hypothetical protein
VITNPAARGEYFEEDLRTISVAGVDHVMRVFFKHMVSEAEFEVSNEADPGENFLVRAAQAMDVLCDEARLDDDFAS